MVSEIFTVFDFNQVQWSQAQVLYISCIHIPENHTSTQFNVVNVVSHHNELIFGS